jgi:biotin carboxylase
MQASWGGGGKGIRCVNSDEEVRLVFKQVLGEVPGSPVFTMKLAPQSRHLEVQLLCDEYGGVVSIFSRDCSIQRRHQKIVEEGPVTAAPTALLKEMEACARSAPNEFVRACYRSMHRDGATLHPDVGACSSARPQQHVTCNMRARARSTSTCCPAWLQKGHAACRRLAASVGYTGAATVEFLYVIEEEKYFFLELNPRLQVEHPVTEWLSGVNIPACQVMIGMGIALGAMADIRALYNRVGDLGAINFEMDTQVRLLCVLCCHQN